jgi:hypothetical protein
LRLARTVSIVLAAVLLPPSGVAARQAPSPSGAVATVDAGLRPTLLAGGAAVLVGGAALLGVGHRVMFGGAGWIQLGESDLDTGGSDAGFRLRLAYGGLVVDWLLMDRVAGRLTLRTLVGAGNGKVFLTAGGGETETSADNFGVVEPEVALQRPLLGHLHVTAGVAYRAVFGLEDLTGVADGDLRGPSLRIGLAIRNF